MSHQRVVADLQNAFLPASAPTDEAPSGPGSSSSSNHSHRPPRDTRLSPPIPHRQKADAPVQSNRGRAMRGRGSHQSHQDPRTARTGQTLQQMIMKPPTPKPKSHPPAPPIVPTRPVGQMIPQQHHPNVPRGLASLHRASNGGGGSAGRFAGAPSADGRRGKPIHQPAPPYAGPVMQQIAKWKEWVEVPVKVFGLPPNITTLHLHYLFSREGQVATIDIFENRARERLGAAKIRFSPPPKRDFWASGVFHGPGQDGGKALELRVMLAEPDRDFRIKSVSDPEKFLPEQTMMRATKIDFGFMYDPLTLMSMQQVLAAKDMQIELELNLHRRIVVVKFDLSIVDPRDPTKKAPRVFKQPLTEAERKAVGGLNRVEKYCFRVPLDQLKGLQSLQTSDDRMVLTMSLDTPPNFYRKAVARQLLASHEEGMTFWKEWDTWFRQTDVVYDPTELKDAHIALKKPKPLIDIGRWTTYRLTFDPTHFNKDKFIQLRNTLQEYAIPVTSSPDGSQTMAPREPAVWKWIDLPPSRKTGAEPSSFLADLNAETVPALAFPVRYQLEACISQGYLNEHNMSRAFVEKLAALEERKATDVLEYIVQEKARVYDPMTIFDIKIKRGSAARPKIPHYCAYSRKATITPSMVYFGTPQVEISNRVVRQYIHLADRFLRVQFTDEKFQGRIFSMDNKTGNAILTRIQRTMMNGITIGDRHFEFLAFGNSQFRENGAYFFAATPYLSAADIRQWMGDFTSIRVPAKYAARLGQCFSTTRAINGTRVEIRQIPDVKKTLVDRKGHAHEYNFTDGVAKISEFLAKMVGGELKLEYVPSVLQFRLGGCKGVLTMWPDTKDREIHMRPSQYKFPAVHNGLEINRWSQFSVATLNRQIILILSALGVDDGVFIRKLQQMLTNLSRAMHDKDMALSLLQKYIDPNQMTIAVAGMISDGFMDVRDPFLVSLLQLWRAWSIKYLKEKARILIEDGAFLLGCTDESQTLKGHFDHLQPAPGASLQDRLASLPEIFIQVPSKENPKVYTVIEGLCVFARNPSLHPGDVRVVNAVDKPELRHLRDVVVLPQTGDRDLASMCSGGDLDGDDYLVIWDRELLPKQWNETPMDYSPPKPKSLDRDVTNRDIINFFVNFMKNDRLGRIATAHMALADFLDDGIRDQKCLRLAALHSQAVDYVKSGEPAFPEKDLRAHKYPHFMNNGFRSKEKVYVSRKILGQLYDQVERVNFSPRYSDQFDPRILNAYQLNDQILADAREIKDMYDAEMRRTMAHYDIKTEFEIWSTFVMSVSDNIRDYKFHEEMGQIATALKDSFRRTCIEKAGAREFQVLGPFAAAMYKVTHQEMSEAMDECRQKKVVAGREVPLRQKRPESMPLMSFPWCLHDILGKIATSSQREQGTEGDVSVDSALQMTYDKPAADKKITKATPDEDILETTEGLTHRGDLLTLFPNESPESEEEVEQKEDVLTNFDTNPFDAFAPVSDAILAHALGPMPEATPDMTSDEEDGSRYQMSGALTQEGVGTPDVVTSIDGTDDLMDFDLVSSDQTSREGTKADGARGSAGSILDLDDASETGAGTGDAGLMGQFRVLSVSDVGQQPSTAATEPRSNDDDRMAREDIPRSGTKPSPSPASHPVASGEWGDVRSIDEVMGNPDEGSPTAPTEAPESTSPPKEDPTPKPSRLRGWSDMMGAKKRTDDDGPDDEEDEDKDEEMTLSDIPEESPLEALGKLVG